jgi:MFS family permease
MQRQRAPTAASMGARVRVLTPRVAVGAVFFAFGVGLGAWSGASAAIVARIGLNPSTYGAALTLFTAAYLLAMSSAGAISRRFTAKRALVVSALASAPALAALLLTRDVFSYFVLQTAYGFLAGMVDLTMNATGARVERGLGRPILAGMHGAASAGVAISATAAGLIATSAAPWISCAFVIVALWTAAAAVHFAVAADRGDSVGAVAVDRRAFASRSLAALGLVIGACIACESAAIAWSGLVLRREAPELAAFAGLGASFFAGCQALQRFNVDRLRARVADRRLIVASLAAASLGFSLVAFDPGFALSVVGFAVIGFGTGAVVPCGFALAATQPGSSAASGLSAAAFFGSFARLPAPFVAGVVAETLSLSAAFALFALLLIAALAATLRFVGPRATA